MDQRRARDGFRRTERLEVRGVQGKHERAVRGDDEIRRGERATISARDLARRARDELSSPRRRRAARALSEARARVERDARDPPRVEPVEPRHQPKRFVEETHVPVAPAGDQEHARRRRKSFVVVGRRGGRRGRGEVRDARDARRRPEVGHGAARVRAHELDPPAVTGAHAPGFERAGSAGRHAAGHPDDEVALRRARDASPRADEVPPSRRGGG